MNVNILLNIHVHVYKCNKMYMYIKITEKYFPKMIIGKCTRDKSW